MDVRQDIRYGVGWSRQENLPIIKVKGDPEWSVKTLAMEPVGPNGETGPFCKVKRTPKLSIKTLGMEPIGLDRKTDPFSRSNDPRSG
ncbi:hypothetical protein KY285_007805 [Solanum tuberosum]|nr:hypothetical protein KY285_007805 [Solanum tuberosum]